ncbi:PEGA domain-containing protein [Nevskia soli]|uniref:PEGA domain-containing protein n=1 Tax=Nevskia soli TaxID=418856 RepID=UPI0015D82509|nr:PEGA domain-containing protein [Nevskia soli]
MRSPIAVLVLAAGLTCACSKPMGRVTVDTRPQGAQVLVGEQICKSSPCTFSMAPGDYRVEAVLDNFEKARTDVTVTDSGKDYKTIRLIPLEPTPDEAKRLHLKEPAQVAEEPKRFK